MGNDGCKVTVIRKIQDDDDGEVWTVGPYPVATGDLVEIAATGHIVKRMGIEMARAIACAIIQCADEIEASKV